LRALRLVLPPLLIAATVVAQTPAASNVPAAPAAVVAPKRTAFLDLVAMAGDRQRIGLEPLVFGRWTLGLIGSHYTTGSPTYYGTSPVVPDGVALCPIDGCPPISSGPGPSYTAWSIDFAVRYYPATLSFGDPRRRLMAYVGEFVGYQYRTLTETYALPALAGSSSSNLPCAYPGCSSLAVDKQHFTGWEPGAEIGVRLEPLGPLFVDVGGWFKIVGVDDPTQRARPGHLESRLVVALGLAW